MTITPEEGRLAVYDDSDIFRVVEDKIVDNSRWSIRHEAVLQHKETGKFYVTHYSVGATENQDEKPYEYDMEVVLKEVEPVETTVLVYVPV